MMGLGNAQLAWGEWGTLSHFPLTKPWQVQIIQITAHTTLNVNVGVDCLFQHPPCATSSLHTKAGGVAPQRREVAALPT